MFDNFLIWIAIIWILAIGYSQLSNSSMLRGGSEIPFSEFLQKIDENQIDKAEISDHEIRGKMKDGKSFTSTGVVYDGLINALSKHGVEFSFSTGQSFMSIVGELLLSWLPMIFLIGVWIMFIKQMQAGGNKTMSFVKSKAKLMTENRPKIKFSDVAGIDEAKEELMEIVEFLKNRDKFQALGGKIPKGCLLIGAPGTGKTLLAKAIAGEANVPFFSISGSDFVEMFVGVGASRVRDMFEQAKKGAPCIVFIDEIDAVGRYRGLGLGGGNDEREQTLNQLLVEMDGFESNEGVILIAATNRPDVLDPALLRPGRFDRQISISLPDILGREKILEVHMKKIALGPDVNIKRIAQGTPGFSGADLANVVNEAALVAARREKKIVTMEDFEFARDKVMMGPEKRSLVIIEEEKRITAYHEAGHALVSVNCPPSDPIHKATIVPRGRALGLVMRLPEKDRLSYTKEKMFADLTVALGGRISEEVVFGPDKVTSGCVSDLKFATKLARSMVMQWGMSDKVGFLYHGDEREDKIFVSDALANVIDSEVKNIINICSERAREIISSKMDLLKLLAEALLKYETLSGQEIKDLLEGKKIREDELDSDTEVIHSSLS